MILNVLVFVLRVWCTYCEQCCTTWFHTAHLIPVKKNMNTCMLQWRTSPLNKWGFCALLHNFGLMREKTMCKKWKNSCPTYLLCESVVLVNQRVFDLRYFISARTLWIEETTRNYNVQSCPRREIVPSGLIIGQ